MENKETQLSTGIKDMSLLVNKPCIAYVFKKTQKIAQALYLITDFFEPSEPLRQSIRKSANLLFETSGIFLRNHQKDKSISSSDLLGSFLETLSLLDTAHLVHLLSDKNHLILKDEITHVMEEIEANKEKKIQLSKEFMATPSPEDYKRQNVPNPNVVKDIITPKPHKGRPADNKIKRSIQVIGLFKPGIEFTIKDITSHLKDVSGKTIQRELLSLVDRGILKKKGEKRWSRYALR